MSIPVAFFDSEDLEGHVAIVERQVRRGLEDAEAKRLARKIVNGKPDAYHGEIPLVYAYGLTLQLAPAGPEWIAPAQNPADQIAKIWTFMVLNVRYKLDPSSYELISTLPVMLETGEEDCDGSTVGLATLLGALGFRTRARVVSIGGEHWEHIYAMVGLPQGQPRRWLALDPTIPGAVPGWEFDGSSHAADFELT